MKRFLSLIISVLALSLVLNAQTLAIHSGNITLLASPDEVGEMMFSGSMLSIGDSVIDVTDIDSMTYSAANFDPQVVELRYSGYDCAITIPLALADSLTIDQDGAYVTVTSATTADPEIIYSLSGSTNNGCFRQEGDYKCMVQLNGVSITSQKGAALHVHNGKRIDIDVVDGTVNNFVDHADTLHDACFHVKGHPEFSGTGIVNITGNGKHAYKSGEYTKFKKTAPTFNILAAPRDGMHISQYFKMNGGKITVANAVKGDGIQVEIDKDSTKELNGQMFLNGGTIDIEISGDSCEGLKCDSMLFIGGGTQNVTCHGKFSKCISVGTHMVAYNLLSEPNVTLVNDGPYVTVGTKNKKSVALKVEGTFYFHTGSISLTADEDVKGKSAAIAGDYVYVSSAVKLKASPAIDVDGAMRVRRTEADMIAYEQGKGITLPTTSSDEE